MFRGAGNGAGGTGRGMLRKIGYILVIERRGRG
jgi:hypothetical protein